MTVESKMRELALDRLQQSEESLEEAEYLFDGNKSPRSVIIRCSTLDVRPARNAFR